MISWDWLLLKSRDQRMSQQNVIFKLKPPEDYAYTLEVLYSVVV